ncbi:DUF2063 domain-containing protein [Ferrovum sp.]|uniref:HvfC/BufC N-terminal domain-containing protein n=1 Tax=Ferrovum sp. TaxID=2609467 RepID=UPI0026104E08|nr:DNA-binding domain-containing protein [Ferrovum sp.]
MSALQADLNAFGRAIVHNDEPSFAITGNYQSYSSLVAMEIYRNNYRGNLHDVLAGAYPVIKQLVGDDFFRFMTRKYIERHPSHSGNLHHYGADLAQFLTTFEPANSLVYIADVAELEWACHTAYFADDGATLDIGRLALIPPDQYENLILHLHPSCFVVRSQYPIATIWQSHQPGACSNFHIELDSGASIALVNRLADVVQVTEVAADVADWLDFLQAGEPMGSATEATLANYPDFDLFCALQRLVTQQLLTKIELREKK